MSEKKKSEGIDFAGFDDVDEDENEVAQSEPTKNTTTPAPSNSNQSKSSQKNTKDSAGGNWKIILIIIAAVLIYFVMGSEDDSETNITSQKIGNDIAEPKSGFSSSSLLETKPPVGSNHVHSKNEIRYCLFESVRLSEMEERLLTEYAVDEYNKRVDDFNKRCLSYRYPQGDYDEVVKETKQAVRKLKNEVSSQLLYWNKGNRKTVKEETKISDKQLIVEIQTILNKVGYKVGVADGIIGPKTISAIREFKKNYSNTDNENIKKFEESLDYILDKYDIPTENINSDKPADIIVKQKDSISVTTRKEENNKNQIIMKKKEVTSESLPSKSQKPNLSNVSASERTAIEKKCGYHKRNSGPAKYYACLNSEVRSLSNSSGPPNLSNVSASERTAIEKKCGYHKRNSGPAKYYACLNSEVEALY